MRRLDLETEPQTIDPRSLQVHRPPPKRDVPYVPTDDAVVAAMLRFAAVRAADIVYDLGCGDGRIVIAAAKQCGARGVGVDIDPQRIYESRENARKARVTDRVQFLCRSFFDTDLRPATVVMLYLLPSINVKLQPKLLGELRCGARIIANNFDMGPWLPDMQATAHHRTLHQWIVPAWVGGTWKCLINDPRGRHSMTLRLRRQFQTVRGTAHIGRQEFPILNGRLFGEQLTFKLIDTKGSRPTAWYAARVEGLHMRGTRRTDAIDGPPVDWGGVWRGEG